jgi:hypothetical protein
MNNIPCPYCGTLLSLHIAATEPEHTVLRYDGPANEPHYEIVRQLGGVLNVRNTDIVGDRSTHQPRTDCTNCRDEFGHGIYAAGVTSGLIEDVTVSEAWGDGIIFDYKHPREPSNIIGTCRNVVLRNVTVMNCRRNAVYIGGGLDYLIDRCNLHAFTGVDPRAALDIEPEKDYLPVNGINILNSNIYGCDHGFGILADNHGISISGLVVEDTHVHAAKIGWGMWLAGLRGTNVFRRCTFHGPVVHLRNAHFENCTFIADPEHNFYRGHIEGDKINLTGLDTCIFK